MEYYEDLETLPIYNFVKIVDGNVNYIFKDYKNPNKLQIPLDTIEKLRAEYVKIIFNPINLSELKKEAKHRYLITQKAILLEIYNIFLGFAIERPETALKVLFLAHKVKGISTKNFPIPDNLSTDNIKIISTKFDRLISILNNKISIAKTNLKDDDAKEEIESINLDEQALQIETFLELGYMLDVKTTSVLRWVHLLKSTNKKAEALEN